MILSTDNQATMVDEKWSDIIVVFTVSLCALKLQETLVILLFEVVLVLNQR